ncbi:unnamed protein product [Chondrus crispus]|uniref:Uncharacterized protein n=1 Tax=Chondrus crispus TaxID=2769 RepID=R7Q8Z6_CHOCR|nr:unnamed protein product [Chondrus crispus]CDF34509.1 unnamed protein product [Chondrus crispus]|eukprot:XP_005714328.1 unnamed protein product [Chondrus crispus]
MHSTVLNVQFWKRIGTVARKSSTLALRKSTLSTRRKSISGNEPFMGDTPHPSNLFGAFMILIV